jgi:hypothetical protein
VSQSGSKKKQILGAKYRTRSSVKNLANGIKTQENWIKFALCHFAPPFQGCLYSNLGIISRAGSISLHRDVRGLIHKYSKEATPSNIDL